MVVNDGQHTFTEHVGVVARNGQHGEILFRILILLELRQRSFRQREHDRDGAKLGQHNEGVCIGGVDNIARVQLPYPDPAIDGRADGGVIQIHFRAFRRRLIGFHRRFELTDQGLLRVIDLLGDAVGLQQVGVALQIHAGIGELRFILRFLCGGLVERGLIRSGIKLRQHITGLNLLSLRE